MTRIHELEAENAALRSELAKKSEYLQACASTLFSEARPRIAELEAQASQLEGLVDGQWREIWERSMSKVNVNQPVIVEEHCENGVTWLVSVCGPNPKDWQALVASSRDEASRMASIIKSESYDCPYWGQRPTGHYDACGECMNCMCRAYIESVR